MIFVDSKNWGGKKRFEFAYYTIGGNFKKKVNYNANETCKTREVMIPALKALGESIQLITIFF